MGVASQIRGGVRALGYHTPAGGVRCRQRLAHQGRRHSPPTDRRGYLGVGDGHDLSRHAVLQNRIMTVHLDEESSSFPIVMDRLRRRGVLSGHDDRAPASAPGDAVARRAAPGEPDAAVAAVASLPVAAAAAAEVRRPVAAREAVAARSAAFVPPCPPAPGAGQHSRAAEDCRAVEDSRGVGDSGGPHSSSRTVASRPLPGRRRRPDGALRQSAGVHDSRRLATPAASEPSEFAAAGRPLRGYASRCRPPSARRSAAPGCRCHRCS